MSVSPQRCFTLMDRGFTFKLISNYINMITATDSKVKTNEQTGGKVALTKIWRVEQILACSS